MNKKILNNNYGLIMGSAAALIIIVSAFATIMAQKRPAYD